VPPMPSALATATDDNQAVDPSATATKDRPLNSNPLTVLITVPTLEIGAADEGVIGLARILGSAGHHPVIVSRGGRLEGELAKTGAAFVRLDTTSRNPLVIARNALALRRLVRERGCGVVHAHGRASAWSAWLAARSCGVPFLTTWYSGFRDQNLLKHWYNGVMARGDFIITASDQIAERLVERYRVPWQRISVISPAIDLSPFDPAGMTSERIAAIRNGWGGTAATRVILIPGRIIRREGLHVVVQAAALLKARGLRDFLFVFVGEDQGRSRYSGELWDLVLATDTADVIRIAGPSADRPASYAAAKMVVGAAIQLDGLPRGLIEAMAMARPVLASDLAAGPEVLPAPPVVAEARMTGLRYRSGDAAALAAAIVRMLSFPASQRQAMGRQARSYVLTEFDRSVVANQVLAVYARAAALRSAGPESPRPHHPRPADPGAELSGGTDHR
jgi:glycosyltransferase involved in cell wall biosynthesis